MLGTLGIFCFE
jgi:hypothetical protein